MADPSAPPESQTSLWEKLAPLAIGLGALGTGFAVGRNPKGNLDVFTDPLRAIAGLQHQQLLGQHYQSLEEQAKEQLAIHLQQLALAKEKGQREVAEEARKAWFHNWMTSQMPQVGGAPPTTTPQAPPQPPPVGPPTSAPQRQGSALPQLPGGYQTELSVSPQGGTFRFHKPELDQLGKLQERLKTLPPESPEWVQVRTAIRDLQMQHVPEAVRNQIIMDDPYASPAEKETAKLAREKNLQKALQEDYYAFAFDTQGNQTGINKKTGIREVIPTAPGVKLGGVLEPGSMELEMAAEKFYATNELPHNLGRGTQGAVNTVAIMKRAAELAAERGDTAKQAAIGPYLRTASKKALDTNAVLETKIRSFEGNFRKNADLVEKLSQQVDRSGLMLWNKYVQVGRRAGSDPQLRALDLALKEVANETARISTTTTGAGGATAEKEIESWMTKFNSAIPVGDLLAVLNTARATNDNRIQSFIEEQQRLTSILSGLPAAPSNRVPGGPSVKPSPSGPGHAPAQQKGWSIRPVP